MEKELTPEEKVKRNKIYKLAYIGIVGGCGLIAMTLFASAQYTKAKLDSSDVQVMAASNILSTYGDEVLQDDQNVYYDRALYFQDQLNHYQKVSRMHLTQYTVLSIYAYTMSILTLVSFGLVLKHSDARKEKEDN